jgi:DNA mismatch repair protein MutL
MAPSGIIKLDPATVSKIAAGEVVERPASVVKELVENSLDAGATQVTVELQTGPERYIRVTDNGRGITKEDAPLVFEGHATSKIEAIDDLDSLGTLGFRGEALSSIAAVSKVELVSSTGGKEGIRIVAEGGVVVKIEDLGCAKGTTIKVTDLFFNTPARLKFLKTKTTETNRIIDIITRYALGRRDVHFRLVTYGNEVINSPVSKDVLENTAHIYGVEIAKKMIGISREAAGIEVHGLISPPEINKGTSQDISFFVNGRYILSTPMVQALLDGYRTQLMKHRYPVCVVFIELDPATLDVNIHPAKTEVRFRNEKGVAEILREAVKEVLGGLETGPEMQLMDADFPGDEISPAPLEETGTLTPAKQTLLTESVPSIEASSYIDIPADSFGKSQVPRMRPLGQVHNMYIVAETKGGVMIIDQHAAAERINLEKIQRRLEEGQTMKQEMIEPMEVELGPKDVNALIENKGILQEMGFEVEEFGNDCVLVRALPVVMGRVADKDIIKDMLEEITALGTPKALEEFKESLQHIVACKASIKAGDILTKEQIESLVRDLYATKRPYSCAHGRPTILSLTKKDLEKRFKRVV